MIALLAVAALSQSLPDLQHRLAEERATAQKLAGREATVLGRLAELERQIEIESRALRAAQVRLRTATQTLSVVEESAEKVQSQFDAAARVLGPRLVARYRLGREGYVRFLLGASSMSDLLMRSRLFNALLRADLDSLTVLRGQAEEAQRARRELAAAHAEQDQSVRGEAERRAVLQQNLEQQRTLLASVQRDRVVHEEAVRDLEEAEKQLSRRVAEIHGSSRKTAPEVLLKASIRRARGRLPFPVERGGIEVRFGRAVDPRFGTVTLQNGIDVRAPPGAPVRAIWGGKVAHAGWFKGFGNLLIVDHGDGVFSLMAHLDQLQKALGDPVRRGEPVGTVGETGSLKGAYLYFELRDGQKPVDPERWLRRGRKQEALVAGARRGVAR
jgi:septal ring factor EnvC (AmiA/AmiB activator)